MKAAIALALTLLAAPPAWATTIDPLSWEELVTRADFVGVVECVTAGGIVARYRVLDPWKGATTGELAIRTAVNYWEPQYPLALVGERLVVTAFRAPPSTMVSTTMGGPVPLWWRALPADFELPLFQGAVRVEGATVTGDAPEKDLGALKARTARLLAAPPEEREAAVLKSVVRSRLKGAEKLSALRAAP